MSVNVNSALLGKCVLVPISHSLTPCVRLATCVMLDRAQHSHWCRVHCRAVETCRDHAQPDTIALKGRLHHCHAQLAPIYLPINSPGTQLNASNVRLVTIARRMRWPLLQVYVQTAILAHPAARVTAVSSALLASIASHRSSIHSHARMAPIPINRVNPHVLHAPHDPIASTLRRLHTRVPLDSIVQRGRVSH